MKKFLLIAMLISAGLVFGLKANASGVGYIDYTKVQENFAYAQQAIKEID
jgi:hypothetical protein